MDQNKAQKLRDVSYRMVDTCQSCVYGNFSDGNLFGSCNLHTYRHLKHTGAERPLSISKTGTCYAHEEDELHNIHTSHFEF